MKQRSRQPPHCASLVGGGAASREHGPRLIAGAGGAGGGAVGAVPSMGAAHAKAGDGGKEVLLSRNPAGTLTRWCMRSCEAHAQARKPKAAEPHAMPHPTHGYAVFS